MGDESQLEITRGDEERSLVPSSARSSLIARGRRDAVTLSQPRPSEREEKFLHLLKLAEAGDSDAQSKLADAYWYGRGVFEDSSEGFRWHLKAAEAGNRHSSEMVGYVYYDQQNYAEALEWLPRNTPTEFGIAEFYLGKCYFYGLGVQQDYGEAVQWLIEASLYGEIYDDWGEEIDYLINYIYALGIWSPSDYPAAVKRWHRSADYYAEDLERYREYADTGNIWAQFFLGLAYAYGRGVTQDDVEAARWFRKAADAGQVDAQFHLALAYAYGRGVTQNYVQAYAWGNLAASSSTGQQQKLFSSVRDAVAGRMTPQQVAEV